MSHESAARRIIEMYQEPHARLLLSIAASTGQLTQWQPGGQNRRLSSYYIYIPLECGHARYHTPCTLAFTGLFESAFTAGGARQGTEQILRERIRLLSSKAPEATSVQRQSLMRHVKYRWVAGSALLQARSLHIARTRSLRSSANVACTLSHRPPESCEPSQARTEGVVASAAHTQAV